MITLTSFKNIKSVLCLGAHPDDIEIGCGGTILQFVKARPEISVRWIVFSGSKTRADEARSSAQAFLKGAADVTIDVIGFRDGFFPYQGIEIKEYFEGVKKDFDPDIVFTHYRDDRHQDHREISNLTWNTFRNHLVLEYEVPKYDGDLASPNFFVPLSSDTLTRKIQLMESNFPSQKGKHWFSADTFRALPRLRGMECANEWAEAFYSRKIQFKVEK